MIALCLTLLLLLLLRTCALGLTLPLLPRTCRAAQNPFEVGDEIHFFHSNKVVEGFVIDIGW